MPVFRALSVEVWKLEILIIEIIYYLSVRLF